MVCIFCRSNTHTKSNCDNENTRATVELIMQYFNEIYIRVTDLHMTRDDFNTCTTFILTNKLTINELKMAIEYMKRMTFQNYNTRNANIKSVIIETLIQMVCDVYLFQFSPSIEDNIANVNHNNINVVIRRVLSMEFSIGRRSHAWRRPYIPTIIPQITRPPATQSRLRTVQTANSSVPREISEPKILVAIINDNCKDEDCPICFEKLNNETFIRLTCNHEFCKRCIVECANKNIKKCALCRSPVTKLYTHTGEGLYC